MSIIVNKSWPHSKMVYSALYRRRMRKGRVHKGKNTSIAET